MNKIKTEPIVNLRVLTVYKSILKQIQLKSSLEVTDVRLGWVLDPPCMIVEDMEEKMWRIKASNIGPAFKDYQKQYPQIFIQNQ